jgi:hypothetical protein
MLARLGWWAGAASEPPPAHFFASWPRAIEEMMEAYGSMEERLAELEEQVVLLPRTKPTKG